MCNNFECWFRVCGGLLGCFGIGVVLSVDTEV